jgi:hypothetical protein
MIKKISFLVMTLVLGLVFTRCTDELDELDGAALIESYNIPGKYKVQITPLMLGLIPVTTGEHDAELINEGDGVLRLIFSGFNKDPMPFEMSVDILMQITPGANGTLIVENIGGDFDANLPEGEVTIDPDDIPEGIEIPDDALISGLHSNGDSTISGEYIITDNEDGTQSGYFDWVLVPNVGLPVTVGIKTNNKIE